eukprot:jgi/Bigna1/70024/fgenesh1_pg.10_\
MFGGTVDDSSTPIMETSLWNFLVSEGAIPPDSVEGKKDEKCVLNKIGQAALHSGFSVGVLLKKLCSQAHVDPGSYEVVASNKAQNRVQNWQWVSETMSKLSKVEVQPIDSTAKMLAVSGDFGVINAILFDLKAAIGPMASAPVVRSEQNGNRPTAVATSSDCSVGSNLRPVLQPMSAVRIDRMRQVLVERLKAWCRIALLPLPGRMRGYPEENIVLYCVGVVLLAAGVIGVGGEAAEDLVPSSEVYQSQPLNQSCLALHRGLMHGFESTELKGSSYQSLLTWMSTLMDQRMNGSDFTHIASAVRLIKDAAGVNYFLHLFVLGLKSHDKDVVVATARILCFVCEHISVELLLPLYMWFYKGDQEGARILTEAFSRQPHLHSTLFRVLRATAGEKIAQVITETLPLVMKSKIDYFALMAEILPLDVLLCACHISKEELSERGTERIIVTLLDAGLKYCKEADNGSNSKAISALQMLTAVWIDPIKNAYIRACRAILRTQQKHEVVMCSVPDEGLAAVQKIYLPSPSVARSLRHAPLWKTALRFTKYDHSVMKISSSLMKRIVTGEAGKLVLLLRSPLRADEGKAQVRSNGLIYKSLVFSLIETHVGVVEGMPGIHVVHQFLQANLKTALRKIPSLPVQVMVEPLIKQHVSQGYNNLDLDFFHSIAIHPRLGIRQALLLLHFVAKVAINDIVYGQLSSKLVFSLLDRFHNQPAVQNYLVKYMRVAFSLLIRATEMLDNVTKGEEGEEEEEENDEKNDNANAPERLNLVIQMIEKVWNAMCSQLSFKSQVSPLAQSVIKDYKEFFPDRDVPEILYKISQQRKSPKAYEPGESDGYSHKRESGYSKQQGKTGTGGGYGAPAKRRSSKTNKKGDLIAVKAGEIADEKAAKAKRAKIEARMRKREQDKERERREKDEFERERQKELQRQKIERQTRRRIEKLRKERMQKQANRQNVLGSTPGGTPLISNEEEMFGDVDKRLWGEFRVQIKRLVRTYAGTRPDPVAKKTFSAINQAHNTLSLAEFLKLWSDLKMSPHQISRREITQMYRTLGGKDQIYGARQLCSGIRMLSQHDKTKAALSKVLGKDAGESDVDERVQAMMKYLKDTWHRCKYTPHSLWDPPKRQSKRCGSISEAEIQKKTQELNKLLEANPQAELPESFEKKTVKKLTKTWPEAEEAAKEYLLEKKDIPSEMGHTAALAGLLKKQFEMVYDFGDPPERETEVLEAVYTGKGDSKRDSEPAPTKSKYAPNRRRKERGVGHGAFTYGGEKRKKDEETKKEEMKKLEERRKEQHRKMAIKMAQAQIKKKQKKAQREKEQREKEEEEQKKKEEEQKKQAVIRKKRKEKIKKYKQQKAEEERKKKERCYVLRPLIARKKEEKMKKIKEEEQKKKIALYLKMKKEKDKLEAAKKKEMEALLAKQREEEDAKKKEKEAREKAREDKRRKEAKAKVEMRRVKKEEEKKAAELAKKKKQEEDAAKEAAKEKRMQDRLARRAKKVKKQLEEAEKSQAASNADAKGQSGGKAATKGKKTPKKKADKTSPIISPKSGAEALSDFAMTDDEGQEKVVLQAVQVGDEGGETLVNADGKEEEWNVQKEEKKGKGEDGATETPAAKEEAKKDEAGADKEEEAKKEEAEKEEAKKEEAKKEEAKKQDAEKEDQAKAGKEEDEKKSEESEKPAPEESGGKES